MTTHHLERALFVVAGRHRGKSTQLRGMFLDARLGNDGVIPRERKLKDFHRLTNERFLYLRLSSPHELKESLKEFLRKTRDKVEGAKTEWGRRWNFACALQTDASNKMPDVVESVKLFVHHFEPERVRVVFLNPDRNNDFLPEDVVLRLSRRLRRIPSVEVCWIDARGARANGLMLADFFAF
jgi:hypothetical protein